MREISSHAGGWRMTAAGIARDIRLRGGDDIVVVPTEELLVLPVDLPLPSLARRLAALPFAVEDRVAEPLADLHLALGAELGPQRHIAAAVRHDRMRDWLAALVEAGLDQASLVPDALMLPRPQAGWAVALSAGRAVVRTDDGAGFAVAEANLQAAWLAGGRPACVALDQPLPAGIATIDGVALTWPVAPPLDLRQGAYAVRRQPLPAIGRRILFVAAAGILAHGAIAAADTLALRHIAAKREAETRALVATTLPAAAQSDDLVSAALAALPAGAARVSVPDRLLPLLARVSAAAGSASFRALRYDRDAGQLELAVDPGSETALASTLSANGLVARSAPGRVLIAAAAL